MRREDIINLAQVIDPGTGHCRPDGPHARLVVPPPAIIEAGNRTPAQDRVFAFMRERAQPLDVDTIAAALKMSKHTVYDCVTHLTEIKTPVTRGKRKYYGLTR